MSSHHFGRTRTDAALSADQRMDARAALKILAGSGLTLEMAARRAVEGRSAITRITVDAAAHLFLKAKLASARPQTFQFYDSRLDALRRTFGERAMDEVSRADFRAWVAAMEVSDATRSGYVRTARALWRWAAAQEPPMAGPPPCSGMVSSAAVRGRTIGFLTVAEVEKIMMSDSPWRPSLALMLFAGVRVEEVAGVGKAALTWRCVDFEAKSIRIPAESSKTGRARLMQDLPEAIWAWLGKPGADDAPICPGQSVSASRWAKAQLGRKCPANALRHTFATYAVADSGEPDRVAGWLGHEGGARLLHAHYSGLARKAEAVAFFAMRPDKPTKKPLVVKPGAKS